MENKVFLIGLLGAIGGLIYYILDILDVLGGELFGIILIPGSYEGYLSYILVCTKILFGIGLFGIFFHHANIKGRFVFLIPATLLLGLGFYSVVGKYLLSADQRTIINPILGPLYASVLIFLGILLLSSDLKVDKKLYLTVAFIISGEVRLWVLIQLDTMFKYFAVCPTCTMFDLFPYWNIWQLYLDEGFSILIYIGFFFLFYKLFKNK